MPFSPQHLQLIETVKHHLPPGLHAWLVGGALRDMLLGRPLRDLDFVLPRDTRQLAKAVAKDLSAVSFLMDEARNTIRVIHKLPDESEIYLDFIQQNGVTIRADLEARDFTINAMALELEDLNTLIDPTGGLGDLHAKKLKTCGADAMLADPVRCLRGLRLSNSLGFRLEKSTITQIKTALPQLDRSAPERIRDEVFRLFGEDHPERVLRVLDVLGGTGVLFPELLALLNTEQTSPHVLNAWEHTLASLTSLQEVLSILTCRPDQKGKSNWLMGMVSLHLGRYRDGFSDYMNECPTVGRTKRALLFFAALYHDAGKPVAATIDEDEQRHFYRHEQLGSPAIVSRGLALELSNDEIDWLERVVRNHMRIHHLAATGEGASPRAIYRFFQKAGDAGVAICLLSLADTLATYGTTITREILEKELAICRQLLEAWWEYPERMIKPPKLLDGTGLMQELSIESGPLVGELLEAVRLAQVEGRVTTRLDALDLARHLLREGKTNPSQEA
ncbi:MAG: HD domain-containing protein [Anaerolineaceae bacterium]